MQSLSNVVPFRYKIGIELTAIDPYYLKRDTCMRRISDDTREYRRENIENFLEKNNILYYACHREGSGIEIPTQPVKTWSAAKSACTRIWNAFTQNGYVSESRYVESDGGHIHLECISKAVRAAICRDMADRPYVNWAFNDLEDSINANCIHEVAEDEGAVSILGYQAGRYPAHYDCNTSAMLLYGPWDSMLEKWGNFFSNKDYAISMTGRTVEFRFFRAASTWREQEEHIAFCQAYVAWIEKRLRKKDQFKTDPSLRVSRVLKKRYTATTAKRAFKELIDSLGLPWGRYKKYADYGIKGRFKYPELLC